MHFIFKMIFFFSKYFFFIHKIFLHIIFNALFLYTKKCFSFVNTAYFMHFIFNTLFSLRNNCFSFINILCYIGIRLMGSQLLSSFGEKDHFFKDIHSLFGINCQSTKVCVDEWYYLVNGISLSRSQSDPTKRCPLPNPLNYQPVFIFYLNHWSDFFCFKSFCPCWMQKKCKKVFSSFLFSSHSVSSNMQLWFKKKNNFIWTNKQFIEKM